MILPMARVQVLGPRDLLPRAIEFLEAQRVLDLRVPAAGGEGTPLLWSCAWRPEDASCETRLAEVVRRCEALLARLPPPTAMAVCERLPEPGSDEMLPRLAALEDKVRSLESRRAELLEEREATDRFSRLVVALAPLGHGIDPALHPEVHGLVLRSDPQALALLADEVRLRTRGECEISSRPVDATWTGVLLVVPRAHGRALASLLFERGVDEVRLPAAYAGRSLVEVLLLLAARARAVPDEIAEVDGDLGRLSGALEPALRASAAAARGELERRRVRRRCGETQFAFVASGFMPGERVAGMREAAAREFGDRVAVLSAAPRPEQWPEVPVVLRNGPRVRPFERLLAFVELPRYGSVDPTPWLAVFFPLFFGAVLGDVAFGLVGVGVALAVRARGWGGAVGRDLAWIALACSLSAMAFGLGYGEALGELGARAGLRPLLLDRRRAIMTFLTAAVALGALHVGIGMALGVAAALRGGRRREAVARAAKLLAVAAGGTAAASAAGVLPGALLRPALAAAVLLLAAGVASGGPMAALEVVLGLGNVLSYARLMALGLASVMLAEVANLLGAALRPAAAGIAAAVLLHAVNFTLGLVSPALAALRLHYVEFFEKFYEEGGAPYRPFAPASGAA